MAYSIQVLLYIYIQSIWPHIVVEHNCRSIWICPLREHRHAPLGGRSGETIELEGREPTISTTSHSHHSQMEIMRKSGFGSKSAGIGWEHIILPGDEDPRNLGQKKWDQRFRKIEYVFALYNKIRWKWYDVYIVPVTLYTSVTPLSPCTCHRFLKMYLQTGIEPFWRCTWELVSSKCGDALGGHDWSRVQE